MKRRGYRSPRTRIISLLERTPAISPQQIHDRLNGEVTMPFIMQALKWLVDSGWARRAPSGMHYMLVHRRGKV